MESLLVDLSVGVTLSRLVFFFQIFMDIYLGHTKELFRFWQP